MSILYDNWLHCGCVFVVRFANSLMLNHFKIGIDWGLLLSYHCRITVIICRDSNDRQCNVWRRSGHKQNTIQFSLFRRVIDERSIGWMLMMLRLCFTVCVVRLMVHFWMIIVCWCHNTTTHWRRQRNRRRNRGGGCCYGWTIQNSIQTVLLVLLLLLLLLLRWCWCRTNNWRQFKCGNSYFIAQCCVGGWNELKYTKCEWVRWLDCEWNVCEWDGQGVECSAVSLLCAPVTRTSSVASWTIVCTPTVRLTEWARVRQTIDHFVPSYSFALRKEHDTDEWWGIVWANVRPIIE